MASQFNALPLESWGLIKKLNDESVAEILKAKADGRVVAFHTAFFPAELLAAFDVVSVPGEWFASICGFDRKKAAELIDVVERSGYPCELCSYARITLGSALGDSSFMGGFPKPDIVLGIEGECNLHLKWFETLARYFNVPFYPMDAVPCDVSDLTNWGEDSQRKAVDYLLKQIYRFVDFMERFTGNKLNEESLLRTIRHAQRNMDLWSDVLDLAMAVPSPITIRSLFTFENTVVSLICKRETTETLLALKRELMERVEKGVAGLTNERIRLLWDCQPPWFDLNIFRYFESKGANLIASPYLAEFGSKHWARYSKESVGEWLRTRTVPECTEDGLWEIARLHTSRHARPRLQAFVRDAVELARDGKVDGAVWHYVRGCKTVPYALYDKKKTLMKELGIPSLILESSTADPRDYSDVRIRSQVDAFIEQILDMRQLKRIDAAASR